MTLLRPVFVHGFLLGLRRVGQVGYSPSMDLVPDTAISDVDGERNRIVIRGRDLADLAGNLTYEEMCGLVWGAAAPNLGSARVEVDRRLPPGDRRNIMAFGAEEPALMTAAVAVAAFGGK